MFGPWVDMVCLGGLTFILATLFIAWNLGNRDLAWVPSVVFVGSILVNYPHYAATYHRVYRRRESVWRYADAALWIPLGLMLLGIACFYLPKAWAPWYCAGYVFFAGYHYSGQSYGIALLYAGKNGFRFGRLQKWLFLLPLYLAYLYPMVYINIHGAKSTDLYGVVLPNLELPGWVATVFLTLFYASFVGYLVFTFYVRETKNKWLPGIVQVVMFSHILWFSQAAFLKGFMDLVPFFHCLQYLVITAYFYFQELRHAPDNGSLPVDGMTYLGSRWFTQYYLVLIVVGAALFIGFPHVLAMTGVAGFSLASAVVVSFLNMHHFVLDSAIWKLRRPEISAPLLS